MAANGDGSAAAAAVAPAAPAPSSPKDKVKFLCSHGGKILPRPCDGHLKYVGGETRVVAVPRGVNFTELMKKLSTLFEGDLILKYRLAAEDMDALVTVRSDEDLKHMIDEHDRHSSEGTPKLRTFLFPSVPGVIETPPVSSLDPHALEQRYIDAVNGVVRMIMGQSQAPPKSIGFYNPSRATFSISSACSSPNSPSPDSVPGDVTSQESCSTKGWPSAVQVPHPMHKVHSSPSLHALGNNPSTFGHGPGTGSAPPYPQYNHYCSPKTHHHIHQHSQPFSSYHPPRPLQVEPYRGGGPERLAASSLIGRAEIGKSPLNQGIGHYHSFNRNHRYVAASNYGYADEYGASYYRRPERPDNTSPRTTIWEVPGAAVRTGSSITE